MFERNTKNNSTYASLGNVFRNSKWTDLKIQNIKLSFVKQFYLFLLCLTTLLILITNNIGLVLMDIIATLSDIIFNLFDLLSISYVLLIYLVFPFVSNPVNVVTLKNKKSLEEAYIPSHKTNSNTNNNFLVSNLYKTTTSLDILKNQPTNYFNNPYINTQNSFNSNLLYVPELKVSNTGILNSNTSISLDHLNKLLQNKHFIFTSSNFSKDLDLMKSDRWLLKNSLVSEDYIRNTNAYTLTKKLIGSSLTNSQLSNRNVWASTNLNKLNQGNTNFTNLAEDLNKLNNSLNYLSKSDIDNFNFFDTSRNFLVNKYLFTNKLRHNPLVFGDLLVTQDQHTFNSLTPNFDLNYKLFLTSMDFNTNPLIIESLKTVTSYNSSESNTKFNLFIVNEGTFLLTNTNLNNLIDLTSQKSNNVLWNSYFN